MKGRPGPMPADVRTGCSAGAPGCAGLFRADFRRAACRRGGDEAALGRCCGCEDRFEAAPDCLGADFRRAAGCRGGDEAASGRSCGCGGLFRICTGLSRAELSPDCGLSGLRRVVPCSGTFSGWHARRTGRPTCVRVAAERRAPAPCRSFAAQRKIECQTASGPVLHRDVAAVPQDGVPDDGQPQPRPSGLPRTAFVDPVEPFEEPRQVLFGHSAAVVVDRQRDRLVVRRDRADGDRGDRTAADSGDLSDGTEIFCEGDCAGSGEGVE